MNKWLTIFAILALGYFIGAKFPAVAQRIGIA